MATENAPNPANPADNAFNKPAVPPEILTGLEQEWASLKDMPPAAQAKYAAVLTRAREKLSQTYSMGDNPGIGEQAVDLGLRGLDYTSGLTRTAAAGAANLATGGDFVHKQDLLNALKGRAPSTTEYLDRTNTVQGTTNIPYVGPVSNRKMVGFAGDVLLNPAIAGMGAKALYGLKDKLPSLRKMINPTPYMESFAPSGASAAEAMAAAPEAAAQSPLQTLGERGLSVPGNQSVGFPRGPVPTMGTTAVGMPFRSLEERFAQDVSPELAPSTSLSTGKQIRDVENSMTPSSRTAAAAREAELAGTPPPPPTQIEHLPAEKGSSYSLDFSDKNPPTAAGLRAGRIDSLAQADDAILQSNSKKFVSGIKSILLGGLNPSQAVKKIGEKIYKSTFNDLDQVVQKSNITGTKQLPSELLLNNAKMGSRTSAINYMEALARKRAKDADEIIQSIGPISKSYTASAEDVTNAAFKAVQDTKELLNPEQYATLQKEIMDVFESHGATGKDISIEGLHKLASTAGMRAQLAKGFEKNTAQAGSVLGGSYAEAQRRVYRTLGATARQMEEDTLDDALKAVKSGLIPAKGVNLQAIEGAGAKLYKTNQDLSTIYAAQGGFADKEKLGTMITRALMAGVPSSLLYKFVSNATQSMPGGTAAIAAAGITGAAAASHTGRTVIGTALHQGAPVWGGLIQKGAQELRRDPLDAITDYENQYKAGVKK